MTKNNSNIDLGNSFQKLKNTQMKKAIIKRVITPGSQPYFHVYFDGVLISCHAYMPNVPKDDIYNEQKNYEAAMGIAKQMEEGATRIEETIYETSDKEVDDIPKNLYTQSRN